jgi:hypothetical protein
MLTSERKLQKLFIKFVEWGKIAKACNLLMKHPELEIPWQKAFEKAGLNKIEHSARWIYEQAKQLGVKVDIHFDYDKLVNYLILHECRYLIKWLISLEPNYSWKSNITCETLSRVRKDTLEILY